MGQTETIIVGGGLAGLAAAAALAERGGRVTLLEARAKLGGRASSFVDPETGETIDNCQHVSLGCCTNLQHFCRTVGIDGLFRTEEQLTFVGPAGEVCEFSESWLPAPLHLLPSFRRMTYLTSTERRLLGRGLRDLARWRAVDGRANSTDGTQNAPSFEQWLIEHGQTPAVREKFWHVVLVSALSETLDRIDVGHARKVFVDTFLRNRRGWRVQIPRVPLDELYGRPVETWLQARGVEVRTGAPVRELELDGDRMTGLLLKNGERLTADDVILAVPHFRVLSLLPESLRSRPEFAAIERIETAPISSVHLWFDRPIMERPHAVLVGRLSQWVFNRSAIFGRDADDTAHCYQVVISASRDVRATSQEATIDAVVQELSGIWPVTAEARLLRSRVVTEQRAVFAPTPDVDRLRPAQQTAVPNLQLAGDWTQTGWPATMEGAVRSGYLAAENVLARQGAAVRILQPDLPVSPLSRWLLRIAD